jgi:hypothetical protein
VARPDALELRRFAGRVAARPPFAGPDVAGCVARPDALELRRFAGHVAARPPFAGPGFAVRRALLGPDALPAHSRRELLLPARPSFFPARRRSTALAPLREPELLSVAKILS